MFRNRFRAQNLVQDQNAFDALQDPRLMRNVPQVAPQQLMQAPAPLPPQNPLMANAHQFPGLQQAAPEQRAVYAPQMTQIPRQQFNSVLQMLRKKRRGL